MTMPSGSDPSGYDLSGYDGTVLGAGVDDLANRTEENVRAAKQAQIEGNDILSTIFGMLWDGLSSVLSLPMAIMNALVGKLFPGLEPVLDSMEGFLNSLKEVPILGDLVEVITGVIGGDLGDLGEWVTGLLGDITSLFNWVGTLVDSLLGAFGIEPLGNLLDRIFDLSDVVDDFFGSFGDLLSDLWTDPASVISAIPQTLVTGLTSALSGLADEATSLIGSIIEGLTGILDLDVIPFGELFNTIRDALQSIPFVNILGIGGPSNIGQAIQETWNQLVGGLVGAIGTGAGLSDLFNIGNLVSSWASLGRMAFDILGIRSNKPLTSGLLSTSESTFSLTEVAAGPTPPTIGVTQSSAVIGFQRISESATKRVVSWLGSGTTNVTGFNVRVWKMDTETGDMALVYESENIAGDLSSSLSWHMHELAEPIPVEPGDVYGIELAVVGTGTHNVVGRETWLPDHPAVFPKNLAATRNSGTGSAPSSIASASVVYSTDIPWIEFGIEATSVGYHTTEVRMFTGNTSVPIPSWAAEVDVIALGGGGGGQQGGTWGISGEGGDAGQWQTATWVRETDFTGTAIVDIAIGAGGEGEGGQGDAGGTTTAEISGGPSVSATGGAGGHDLQFGGANRQGHGPGNQTYRGNTFVGGATENSHGRDGNPPGGGGAGGDWIGASLGGNGAPGAVWLVFRPGVVSTPEVEEPEGDAESYSDNFNRSNSSTLGSDWTGYDVSGTGGQLKIASNQAVADTALAGLFAEYNDPLGTNNHSVSVKVGTTAPVLLYLCLRSNGTDAVVASVSGVSLTVGISAVSDMDEPYDINSATAVGSTSGTQDAWMSPGDVYAFEASGDIYALKKNGSTILSWNGSAYSGYVDSPHRKVAVGVYGYTNSGVDDFEAADI